MDFFSIIPEGKAIMLSNGVYSQRDLYTRAGRVYAKYGSGYVRLHHGGDTSAPKVRWVETDTPNGSIDTSKGQMIYEGTTE